MKAQQNIIGKRLKAIRLSQDLTQDQVAARCGRLGWDITENTVTKIETEIRCVTDKELIILAKALRVKLKDMLPQHTELF